MHFYNSLFFVAQQFNVTNAMYEFQCSIWRQKWKLSLGDHIRHVMAINSILLLSPNKWSDNLSPHFCEASLRTTMNKIKSIYGLNLPRMQIKTVTDMISIIQGLDIEAISCSQAIVKLLQLDLLQICQWPGRVSSEVTSCANWRGCEQIRSNYPFRWSLFMWPVWWSWRRGFCSMDKRHSSRSTKKRNLVDTSSRSYCNKLERCEMVDQPWIRWSKTSMSWNKQLFIVERSNPNGDILQKCPGRTKLVGYSRFANHWTIHYLLSLGIAIRRPLCFVWIRDSPAIEKLVWFTQTADGYSTWFACPWCLPSTLHSLCQSVSTLATPSNCPWVQFRWHFFNSNGLQAALPFEEIQLGVMNPLK